MVEGPEKVALERIKKKREEFCSDLKKVVPKLKKEIEEKNTISMGPKDLIGKMGLIYRLKYRSKHPTSIYWNSKYCLWKEGIYVAIRKKDHEKELQMRARTPKDVLPQTLKDVLREKGRMNNI